MNGLGNWVIIMAFPAKTVMNQSAYTAKIIPNATQNVLLHGMNALIVTKSFLQIQKWISVNIVGARLSLIRILQKS